MASIISAGTTSATALNMSADTSGILQLAYNNGTIGLTINASGNYGFATTTVATNFRAQFLGTAGSNTGPAASGTTQSASAVLRLQAGGGFTGTLDIGQGGATGSWLQSCDTGNLATNYSLLLNPNGGAVLVGTTSSLGARLAVYGTSGSSDSNIQITNPGYGTGCIGVNGTSSNFKIYNCYSSGTLGTGAGIDIDTSGNLLVGATSPNGTEKFNVNGTGTLVAWFQQNTNTSGYSTIRSGVGSNGNNTSTFHFWANTNTVGNWYLYGNGTTSFSSDQRLKKNIETTRDGYLEDLAKLRVVKYNWKNDADGTPKELGLIAQEVEQVFAGLVQDDVSQVSDEDTTKYKQLKQSVIPFMLLKAIQELKAINDQQAETINALTARVVALENK